VARIILPCGGGKRVYTWVGAEKKGFSYVVFFKKKSLNAELVEFTTIRFKFGL
jgi:hypothetical protein